MEQGIRAGVLSVEGEVDGGGGVVGARAGNDFDLVVDPLDTVVHGSDVLPDGHGGRLAGGAAHADGVPAGDLVVNQLSEGVVVNGAVFVKGSDQRDAGAGKNRSSHKIQPFLIQI